MSRLCAKPTCSSPAVSWLELVLADRLVIERTRSTSASFGLCDLHRNRFVVPDGWEIRVASPAAHATELHDPVGVAHDELDSKSENLSTARTRSKVEPVDERQPWFAAERTPAHSESFKHPLASAWIEEPDDEVSESVGALLHRAFHGPDRDEDLRRRTDDRASDDGDASDDSPSGDQRTNTEVAKLGSRRTKVTGVDYEDTELPFPPFDLEHQKAVS